MEIWSGRKLSEGATTTYSSISRERPREATWFLAKPSQEGSQARTSSSTLSPKTSPTAGISSWKTHLC